MDLIGLKDAHAGEDVWVVGSDASMDFFPDQFFAGRTVITVNVPHVPSRYCVSKNDNDHRSDWVQEHVDAHPETLFVVSKHCNGDTKRAMSSITGAVLFDHHQNQVHTFNAQTHIPNDPNMLLVSYSTIGSALHLAAYTGARTCFVVGASGGEYGDKVYRGDYSPDTDRVIVSATSLQTQGICDELSRRYGTQFVAVLPWANMRLGGVEFRSDYGALN